MAVSLAQYVDLLFKKLQGVAKTANAVVKNASNESIASPAFLRGDIIWVDAVSIPDTAAAVPDVTRAYTGANAIQCTADTTVPPIGGIRPTWLTNTTYWVPQEMGPTWLPKVFVGPPGAANIEATGTQIFAPGISGTGEYYFDTQAGVLNFIGETIPAVLTSGNVVYVSGYQYIGTLGLTGNGSIITGNITFANTTISTNLAEGNITITPTGNGYVNINTTTGLVIPVGNTAQQPTPPATGAIRFNTTESAVEVYTGSAWELVGGQGVITNQIITPDGTSTSYTLNQSTTEAAILVSLNGIVQVPGLFYAYTVTGNTITFSEAPLSSDLIDIRFL